MVPGAFDYYSPSSLQEVLQLLQEHGEDAKILAGGHSLVPLLKLRLAEPPVLIDLAKVEELRGISRSNGSVVIGAMTTQNEIEFSEELKGVLPILPEAAAQVGDPMVRNRGTLGGSLAHADPAGDMPAVVLALDAVMSVTGPGGERTIPAGEFFIDVLTSALEPGEVLTRITIPTVSGKVGMSYQKFRHPASGYAVVGVAAVVTIDESGLCQDCRVGVTGATARASRAAATEDALVGRPLDDSAIEEAAGRASEGMEFIGDIYASEEYRENLVKVYTKRALKEAMKNAG